MKMRVACFGRFCDDTPGGIEAHVESLLAALQDQVDFTYLVPSRDSRSSRFSKGKVPVVRTASWNVDGSLALSPGLVLEAWRQHRRTPYDLVHLHFPDPMSHLASMAIPAHVPRIITWHAEITRQRFLRKLYAPWQKVALRQARSIIVATASHLKSSADLMPPEVAAKVKVIPYGFDLSPFTNAHPQAVQIRQQYPGRLIFAVGRHVYYKGFDVLLKAVRELPSDVQLILGGSGPLSAELKALAASLGLQQQVHFTGLIPDDLLPAYYQACDVFCLPSVSKAEAFGIVQVEAMAAGKPVVSSALGNGVDYVNQHGITGMTVAPNDPAALAAAFSKLFADEHLCAKLGRQSRVRVEQEFSVATMAERTLQAYFEATGMSPQPD